MREYANTKDNFETHKRKSLYDLSCSFISLIIIAGKDKD